MAAKMPASPISSREPTFTTSGGLSGAVAAGAAAMPDIPIVEDGTAADELHPELGGWGGGPPVRAGAQAIAASTTSASRGAVPIQPQAMGTPSVPIGPLGHVRLTLRDAAHVAPPATV